MSNALAFFLGALDRRLQLFGEAFHLFLQLGKLFLIFSDRHFLLGPLFFVRSLTSFLALTAL
ncbi:hypothetical protein NDA01_02210 [Trichocoleus desertorum AS-A10]|uniref:hypothetical protein n=1 Tax=Trichocoleus desertorum TaxID=1481672 RepID=UPI00329F3D5F